MNWLDIVLIAALLLTTFLGLWRGLISMLMPLIGIVVGVVLAGYFHATVGGWLPIDDPEHAAWAGYAVIIVVVLIVFVIMGFFFKKLLSWTFMGWIDRLGGAILGLVSGMLLCAAALAACVKFEVGAGAIAGSGVSQLFLDWFPVVLGLLPGDFDAVQDFFS